MENIAPQIVRQRLLIEATFTISINKAQVSEFLLELANELGLRIYGRPIIHSPSGEGKDINQFYQ